MNENPSNRASVTLKTIADALGINASTASRAMHDDLRLRPETRAKVQQAARQMGYRPNPYVTAFATHVRNHRAAPPQASVAILDCNEDNPNARVWSQRYEQGIRDRAADHGFGVDILRLHEHGGRGDEVMRILEARGIRGMVVMPVRGQAVQPGIDFRAMASSTIDLSLRYPALHRASPDYFQGMQLALQTLHARRHRRIGFCTNRGEIRRIGSRWLGAFLAWQAESLPEEQVKPHINPFEDVTQENAEKAGRLWDECRESFERWLETEKPDAIVSNDLFFLDWIALVGLRVPGDIGFASLGIFPGTTTRSGVDQRTEHIGAAALDLVVGQIQRNEYGIPAVPQNVLVPAVWVDGETIA